jgi:hypothetical protein
VKVLDDPLTTGNATSAAGECAEICRTTMSILFALAVVVTEAKYILVPMEQKKS